MVISRFFLFLALVAILFSEGDTLGQFGRGLWEEHLCEIILKFGRGSYEECLSKIV